MIDIVRGGMEMITLSEKQHIIISAHLNGKSQRYIARETGIDRKTISKYVKDYESTRQEILNFDGGIEDIRELQGTIVERPKYKCTNKKKLTDEIINKIKGYIEENQQKRHAGRHKVPDMYVGKRIFIKIYSNDIVCFSEGKKIACHKRKLGFYEWSIKLMALS